MRNGCSRKVTTIIIKFSVSYTALTIVGVTLLSELTKECLWNASTETVIGGAYNFKNARCFISAPCSLNWHAPGIPKEESENLLKLLNWTWHCSLSLAKLVLYTEHVAQAYH